MDTTQPTTVFHFAEIQGQAVGGKAHGLARLLQCHMRVPNGFVLTEPASLDEEQLAHHLRRLEPGPKAVRSSAIGEDGKDASFAGQFDTILHCHTQDEIVAAIQKCVESAASARAKAYQQDQDHAATMKMCVIVQEMVDARVAGVLFTVDPVQERRDRWLIDVAPGTGDALVSGKVEGESKSYPRQGELSHPMKWLGLSALAQLRSEALQAEAHFGIPLDLEWAIDQDGTLYWLQARPITTLSDTHINELDTALISPEQLLTRGNIGEMMPGPVTPLTFSTFGRAIEVGLQDFYVACGARPAITDEGSFISLHYNHLFINLSSMYEMCKSVLLVRKENIDLSVVGMITPHSPQLPLQSWWRRAWNQWRQIKYLQSAPKRLAALQQIANNFALPITQDPKECYNALTAALPFLDKAYIAHYATSAQSGSLHSAMLAILSGGQLQPSLAHQADAASLLVAIDNIEGADVVVALEHIAGLLQNTDPWREKIQQAPDEILLKTLQDGDDPAARAFRAFIERHGHRCVREAELSELDWSQAPLQVVRMLRQQINQAHKNARRTQEPKHQRAKTTQTGLATWQQHLGDIEQKLPWWKRIILRSVLPKVRQAVSRREATKSLCIKIQQGFKRGYLALGQQLAQQGQLAHETDIFFLTHQELGLLVNTSDTSDTSDASDAHWKAKTKARKQVYEASKALAFADLHVGMPQPTEALTQTHRDGICQGVPVSTGTIEGRVRIIHSLAEAVTLEKGDIMVCQFTDVGWTPFLSTIGGLITEIGSPLSHGAVVAREYGIPAVVNMKGAMQKLQEGAWMRLDGTKGTIETIEAPRAAQEKTEV